MSIGTVGLKLAPKSMSAFNSGCLRVLRGAWRATWFEEHFFPKPSRQLLPHIQQQITVYAVYTSVLFNVTIGAVIVCIDIWPFVIPPCILVPRMLCYDA